MNSIKKYILHDLIWAVLLIIGIIGIKASYPYTYYLEKNIGNFVEEKSAFLIPIILFLFFYIYNMPYKKYPFLTGLFIFTRVTLLLGVIFGIIILLNLPGVFLGMSFISSDLKLIYMLIALFTYIILSPMLYLVFINKSENIQKLKKSSSNYILLTIIYLLIIYFILGNSII